MCEVGHHQKVQGKIPERVGGDTGPQEYSLKNKPHGEKNDEGGPVMWSPIVILAALTILLGVFSGALAGTFTAMAQSLFG